MTFAIRYVRDQHRRRPEVPRAELMGQTLLHYLLRKEPGEPPDRDPLELEAAALADRVDDEAAMEELRRKIVARVKEIYPATLGPQRIFKPGMALRFDRPHYDLPGRWCVFHIYNPLQPKSILDDVPYMIRNFRFIMDESEKTYGCDTLYTYTWLNSLPQWLRFFPEEWSANRGVPDTVIKGNLGYLGQFLNAAGNLNWNNAEYLLTTGTLKYPRRASYCTFEAMRRHLDSL